MGMFRSSLPIFPASLKLESPDVITQFHPRHQPGLGEFRQIAVDRGPIKALIRQGRRHLGMGLGTVRPSQVLQDCKPSGSTAKACSLDHFPDIRGDILVRVGHG